MFTRTRISQKNAIVLGWHLSSLDDCVSFSLSGSVRRESNNARPLLLAKPARGTSNIVANRSRTNDDLVSFRSNRVFGLIGREDDDNRSNSQSFQLVGVAQVIGGQVNGKPVFVRLFDRLRVRGRHRLMGIREAFAPLVGLHKLAKLGNVDSVSLAGQIARLIVSPQLPARNHTNGIAKRIEIQSPITVGNVIPMNIERAGFGITTIPAKGARGRAGFLAGGGNGNRTRLDIKGGCGKVKRHEGQ